MLAGMHEHITLLRPDEARSESRQVLSALPRDLLEQVRGRVRFLTLVLLVAFALEPVIFLGTMAATVVTGHALPADVGSTLLFQWVNVGAAVASAGLWWVTRQGFVSSSRLLTLGLAYEIVICFVVALTTDWQHFILTGILPNLTWVPGIVILFPLVMPGPPRRMLAAAIAAAAMSPLALLLLDLFGRVTADQDAYLRAVFSPAIAVGFAYVGARVVYRLGRQVAAARELGSYRLEELLGQGGMGEVWRARHRMLARPAAIKLIRPALSADARSGASSDAMRRFEREAQAIARLRSPHTVDLFDFGVADDGAFYYAMELLEGLDADALVRRFGPVPAERAVHLLRQMCHSLSEAESRSLVHRDIKPANVFLCHYGEEHDFVKVLDFGLVKALDDRAEAPQALTGQNVVSGTPAFMAPEQAMGLANIDGRADIYATGCVAYWLLTGHLVFTADSAMALLVEHARTAPIPPSARCELPIPAGLDRVVLSCLAKDPAARPQTARALSTELAAVELGAAWTEERAAAWWAMHRPAST